MTLISRALLQRKTFIGFHVKSHFSGLRRIFAALNRNCLMELNSSVFSSLTTKTYCDGTSFDKADETVVVNLNETQTVSFKDLTMLNPKTISCIMKDLKQFKNNNGEENLEKSNASARRLRNEFIQRGEDERFKQTMTDNLNSLLYFFYSSRNFEDLIETFHLMKSSSLTNEASYSIMIKHKTQQENWRSGLQLVQEMKSEGIQPHSRTYHCIICNAVETNDLIEALSLFKKMQDLEIIFSDDFYSSLIDASINYQKCSNTFLLSIFDLLQGTGFTLGNKTFRRAMAWFSRYTNENNNVFDVAVSSVDQRGICNNCGTRLKEFHLTEPIKLNLEKKLFEIAKDGVFNKVDNRTNSSLEQLLQTSNIHTSSPSTKIDALRHLVNISGPFDVVLDVLNIAYAGSRGFNSFQVKRVAKHFLENGQRVLAVCSSPLLSNLIKLENSTFSNQHMVNLLHYLKRNNCGIFFVDDTKEEGHIDDYFLLLSIVFHEMKTNIVTCDNFFDLLHSTDAITKRQFRRWMQSHKIALKHFTTKGKPIFAPRMRVDIDVQNYEGNWHLPRNDGKWLCCTKRLSE